MSHEVASRPSLYADDLDYARTAFEQLLSEDRELNAPEYHPERQEFTLLASEDLRRRCEFIPQEAIPERWEFVLSVDRHRVMEAIEAARRTEGLWPRVQLFWELHPVMEWLMDRLMVQFGRHEAPIVLSPSMQRNDIVFLFQGVLSNQRSQPVITDWFGVRMTGDRAWARLSLESVIALSGVGAGMTNPGAPSKRLSRMGDLLPEAVQVAYARMRELRTQRAALEEERLGRDLAKLDDWHARSMARLQGRLAGAIGSAAARLERERDQVRGLYEHRQRWLQETYTVVDAPYIRLVAVFAGS